MLKNILLISLTIISLLFTLSKAHAATPYTYCFIGDSRFVGMSQSVNTDENIIWIARNSANQGWYWENRNYISSLDRNTVIIYELGINDFNVDGCLKALYDLESLGFKHIYFTSITPVDEYKEAQYGYKVKNRWIEDFNNTIRNNLPNSVAMMDGYEYLSNMGFTTIDGVHYTEYTYSIWLYNILNSL